MQIKEIGSTDFKNLLGNGRVMLFNGLKKKYHSCAKNSKCFGWHGI